MQASKRKHPLDPGRDMSKPRSAPSRPPDPEDAEELADRLHSAAIHLLRRVRIEDVASGLTGPRLSALSVVVFSGPIRVGDLAAAEQVSPPTISRMVREMEAEGLVERVHDPEDRRLQLIRATLSGRKLLEQGRSRRVARLARQLDGLTSADRRTLARAAAILDGLSLPPGHPRQRG